MTTSKETDPFFDFLERRNTPSLAFSRIHPEIPKGWSLNYQEFVLKPEEPEKYIESQWNCPECGSAGHFHHMGSGDSLIGNKKKTAFFIIEEIPTFRCDNCGVEGNSPAALNEIAEKADKILIDLSIRKSPSPG